MRVSETVWAQLTAAWEEAVRRYEEAWSAYDKIPLPDNDTETKSVEEEAYESASTVEYAEEDRLLGVVAPHASGVALQLRIFARRHHSVARLSCLAAQGAAAAADRLLRNGR